MQLIEISKIAGICLFAYLFGSIPWGYIIGRAKGIDLRKVGSGKTGTTNVGRVLGWRYRIWVAYLDAWKGAMPVVVAIYVLRNPWWVVVVFLLYMLGAILSIWMKLFTGSFRAGAGVAALIGGLLILAGWKIWLIIMACWLIILIFFVRRKMSAASLCLTGIILVSIGAIPIFLYTLPILLIALVALGLVWWAHRENLQRIRKGEESSIKLPGFLDKLPDDLISLTIKGLQWLIKKLQGLL